MSKELSTWRPERKATISYEDGRGWVASITVKKGKEEMALSGLHALSPLAAALGLSEWIAELIMHPRRVRSAAKDT